jgi:hypothetical protein
VLIGGGAEHRISVEEIAEKSGTIPYVVTTQLGSNVERRYIGAQPGDLLGEPAFEVRNLPEPRSIPAPEPLPQHTARTTPSPRVASA